MPDLSGKTAIVTGASTGIGRGIAWELARAGAVTVLAARSVDKLEALAKDIADEGGKAIPVQTDVSKEPDILALFETTMEKAGPVDFLVNNAGIADATPLTELTSARWQQVLAVNLNAAVYCAREAMRVMKGRGGRIINISSLSAKVPRPNSPAYTMAKFALEGLTRSICLDGRADNISASSILPGATRSMLAPGYSDVMEGDCLEPEMIGELVIYLCGLPLDLTILDTTILPIKVPFLGRG